MPRPPKGVAWLIAINVAVALTLWILYGVNALSRIYIEDPADILTLPSSFRMLASQPWSLLTYMVTQTALLHLLFNMLWLYWFGLLLGRIATSKVITALYIAGGICGGLLFLIAGGEAHSWDPHLAGASASVMALTTAVACRMPEERVNLLLFGSVRVVWIAVIALALAFLGGGGGLSDGFTAHLGGALAGLAYGLYPLVKGDSLRRLRHRIRLKRNAKNMRQVFQTEDVTGRSIEASRGRADNRARLDEILDKIRLSGYDSLTSEERRELEILSRNI